MVFGPFVVEGASKDMKFTRVWVRSCKSQKVMLTSDVNTIQYSDHCLSSKDADERQLIRRTLFNSL